MYVEEMGEMAVKKAHELIVYLESEVDPDRGYTYAQGDYLGEIREGLREILGALSEYREYLTPREAIAWLYDRLQAGGDHENPVLEEMNREVYAYGE